MPAVDEGWDGFDYADRSARSLPDSVMIKSDGICLHNRSCEYIYICFARLTMYELRSKRQLGHGCIMMFTPEIDSFLR